MTAAIMNFLTPNIMHALGWALLHFLWQGTALAALSAAALAVCRRTQVRYILGVATLILMSLAPVVTFVNYLQQHGTVQVISAFPATAYRIQNGLVSGISADSSRRIVPSLDALPWLVEAWLLGVAFFGFRSAGGFFLLERERRKRSTVVGTRLLQTCLSLQQHLGISRAIRYCECQWLQAPAVIGWFKPIVFLPATALTGLSEEQLRAVIAHELAHIRRFDPFVNVFQVCVEALLFYHPAVWWLNKRIRAEREHCCDELAVNLCGDAVEYARALTLMEEWRSAPVFAMAANRGPLTERVVRVLGLKTIGSGMRGIGWTGSVLCLGAALVAGHALLDIARPPIARAAMRLQAATNANGEAAQQSNPKPAATPKPSAARTPNPASTASSYIDAMRDVGLKDLTVDQLIALKVQDVTPEYVREMREQGLNVDAENLVAMRVQGVTPEEVRQWRGTGLNLDQNRLVALKVQGADPEYYRALKEAGIDPDVDRLIALKVQGVTPEYVRALRAAGLSVSADQVIAFKVQDLTPEYLKHMHDLGVDANANELIGMKVQDVTPEYVQQIHALGLKPTANELIALRVQDVTPEYIKALQSAGYKASVNEIIGAKVQDVTPEFIERAKAHGFKDLTLQKLMQLRQLGILDSKADL